jgi:hypothetical protein
LIQLIRKIPYQICHARTSKAITISAGKYQDSENDKAAQQEHNVTISKIDKEALDRLTEESRQLKFDKETALRDFTTTKAQLVCLLV